MKTLPPGMAEHLASGATTLCWCWRLTRRDGTVLGFTDHDRTVTFDGTDFEAGSGLDASEINDRVGLNVDSLEVGGAITSERLAEADLSAGLYDDAAVEIYRVNWQDPAQRLLMRSGSLGEVKRQDKAFAAEIRGLGHYLQQPKGRVLQYGCDVDLGSAKCGIDLESPTYRATGNVVEVSGDRAFVVALTGSYAEGWFARGRAVFETGAAAGFASEVRAHVGASGGDWIELWQPPIGQVAVNDQVVLTAGCDKQLGTCRDRFANAVNFRGFPHMPGNDFVTRFARSDEA